MLPAPTAPSEGSAGVRNLIDRTFRPANPLSILAHQLRRRFPSCISLFREARLTYSTTWPEGSLVVRSARPGRNRNSSQNRPMFRGPSWDNLSRVPLRSPEFRRTPGAASHDRKIISSGASSRLARDEPESSSHSCRRRSVLLPLPRPCCRCRPFRGDWDFRPDHLKTMHLRSESRKQNFR